MFTSNWVDVCCFQVPGELAYFQDTNTNLTNFDQLSGVDEAADITARDEIYLLLVLQSLSSYRTFCLDSIYRKFTASVPFSDT